MATAASGRDVIRLRLERQGLVGEELSGPAAVVERLLAVQAQDFAAAKWALGTRAPGTTRADVDAAVAAGTIVRSWPMRGTLHFVPARELAWMQELTTARILARARTQHAQLGLDGPVFEKSRAVALETLTGGRTLTRAGFLAQLEAHGIDTSGQRGYHMIWYLAQTGTLCWGPPAGTQQALVLRDEWVPHPRILGRDEALGEFLLRYLTGHGPATLKDFAWWAQLTVADAKVGLAVARDRLVELSVDDATYYLPASVDVGEAGAPVQRSPVLALPGFDEYLLGYQDRSLVVTDAHFLRVVPGKNGIFLPLLLCGGRVVGTWRKYVSDREVTAEAVPFDSLTVRQQTGFARSIRHYARFTGAPVRVRPAAGPG